MGWQVQDMLKNYENAVKTEKSSRKYVTISLKKK